MPIAQRILDTPSPLGRIPPEFLAAALAAFEAAAE